MTAVLVDDVLEELREGEISELASRALNKSLALVFMVISIVQQQFVWRMELLDTWLPAAL